MSLEKKSLDKCVFKTIKEANEYFKGVDIDTEVVEGKAILIEKNNAMFTFSTGKKKDDDYGELKWRQSETIEQTLLSPTVADLFRAYMKAQMNAEEHKKNFLEMVKVIHEKSFDKEKKQLVMYGDENLIVLNTIECPLEFTNLSDKEKEKLTKEINDEYEQE